MPFGRSPPQPQEALQKTKAFSFENTSDTVSLISESSLSIGSTVTLENLPLPPPLGFSPPWSTEGRCNDGLLLAPSRAGRTDQSPGWSLQHSPNSDFCVTDIGDWQRDPNQRGHRVPFWDTTRSAISASNVDKLLCPSNLTFIRMCIVYHIGIRHEKRHLISMNQFQ
jgi:hypothetical protein